MIQFDYLLLYNYLIIDLIFRLLHYNPFITNTQIFITILFILLFNCFYMCLLYIYDLIFIEYINMIIIINILLNLIIFIILIFNHTINYIYYQKMNIEKNQDTINEENSKNKDIKISADCINEIKEMFDNFSDRKIRHLVRIINKHIAIKK